MGRACFFEIHRHFKRLSSYVRSYKANGRIVNENKLSNRKNESSAQGIRRRESIKHRNNAVFKHLSATVFGDASRHELMRYMIAHRINNFPQKYHKYDVNGKKPVSTTELQAVADIFHAEVEMLPSHYRIVPQRMPPSQKRIHLQIAY